MDSNLYISALQRQPCLLKTNSTRVLLTWLITLLLIICPSSYKARPDNLIGLNSFWSGIISPQRNNARPNFPTSNVVDGAKYAWYPGYSFLALIHFSLTRKGTTMMVGCTLKLSFTLFLQV